MIEQLGLFDSAPVVSVDSLPSASMVGGGGGFGVADFTGDKFLGGFGETMLYSMDYWTLRTRSTQLFTDNLYARGLIRRLVTNEINVGLAPESSPDELIIGVAPDSLNDWTEDVETRFNLWSKSPQICDFKKASTFGEIQRTAKRAALVSGDVLVVIRPDRATGIPSIQLVSGDKVQTPWSGESRIARAGNTIMHGVERDKHGRVVAYHVRQDDGSFKRLPSRGRRSGRKLAWLEFGTDKLMDDVRGAPLLALVLQSLKEIDRYRDSAQRKAVINSILAMFIKKGADAPGTLPISNGAVRRDTIAATSDPNSRSFDLAGQIPGLVLEELQTGEEPVGFHSQGTDINFPVFEEAILRSIAWANEIPPEILVLSFQNNYSASQAAINEFKIYLSKQWYSWGETFCSPIYSDWLLSETLLGKIKAPGLLNSWRDPARYEVFAAWVSADWYGTIKPSTDMLKAAKGAKLLVAEGWSTNAREARMLTGTKFSKNIKRIARENELKIAALTPMAEFMQKFGLNTQDMDQLKAHEENMLLLQDMQDTA